jgi:hypothetical protein
MAKTDFTAAEFVDDLRRIATVVQHLSTRPQLYLPMPMMIMWFRLPSRSSPIFSSQMIKTICLVCAALLIFLSSLPEKPYSEYRRGLINPSKAIKFHHQTFVASGRSRKASATVLLPK